MTRWLRRCVAAGLIATLHLSGPARSLEEVSFESAVFPPSAFKVARAARDGRVLIAPRAERISGLLARPAGAGPFAAVVLMHGCGGRWLWNDVWRERLVAWGYVVLDLDSFRPRGIFKGVCDGGKQAKRAGPVTRARDAHGAKRYLGRLPFVDAARIAVIGMSHGGISALQAIHARNTRAIGAAPFAAAVALYPRCEPNIVPDAPLLVLIGELDNQTLAEFCARFDAAWGAEPDITVVIYPGVHHGFDHDGPESIYKNHYISRHHPEAARDAIARTKAFLARALR